MPNPGSVRIRFKNPDTIRQLQQLAPRFAKGFWLFANKELRRECVKYMTRRTPKRTGHLRESIVVHAQQTGEGFNGYAEIGYTAYYAEWVPAANTLIRGKPLRNKVNKAFRIAAQKALAAAAASIPPG